MSEDQVVVYKGDRSFRTLFQGAVLMVGCFWGALAGPGYMRFVGPFGIVFFGVAGYMWATTRLEIGDNYAEISTGFTRRMCNAPASVEVVDRQPVPFQKQPLNVLYVTEKRPGGATIRIALHVFDEDSRDELEKAIRKAMK